MAKASGVNFVGGEVGWNADEVALNELDAGEENHLRSCVGHSPT